MRTYIIELRCDFKDEERYEVVKQAIVENARTLLATAMLVAEKRPPQIAVHSKDFMLGNEDLDVTADV